MTTNYNIDPAREFRRQMLRSSFQSLFWAVLVARKRRSKFTLKALADKLGINKSYVTRSFSSPPNWQIDKMSDMADALGVDLVIEARDRATGEIFTPHGRVGRGETSSRADLVPTKGKPVQTSSDKPELDKFVRVRA